MFFFLLLYSIFYILVFLPLFAIASIFNTKMRISLIGRISQQKKIRSFAKSINNSKVIFFHSASVGEWEQSLPVIKKLKAENEDLKIVASFFSPSGIKHAKVNDVDLSIYLPFDIYFSGLSLFRKIKPSVWVISKYDVWPALLFAAKSKNIPVILASAELAADSKRYKGINAKINSIFYKHIDYILPVSEEYKTYFKNIYPYSEKLIVSGDARYDQIITKSETVLSEPEITIFKNNLPITFIAGSIWPGDEKHLLPAILKIYKLNKNLQLILVPHELHESHIKDIESFFAKESIRTERFTDFDQNGGTEYRIAIINTIGILSKLYKNTHVAYVGGGFTTGVHNVAEPAVFGNPVIFGPKHINSFEAVQLYKKQVCFAINNEEECFEILNTLIENKTFRETCGTKAKSFIYENKGATETIFSLVKKYL